MASFEQRQCAARVILQIEQSANAALLILQSAFPVTADDDEASADLQRKAKDLTGQLAGVIRLLADGHGAEAQRQGDVLLTQSRELVGELLREPAFSPRWPGQRDI
jgi:hypothetical protein